jgi:hypothetical protein
MIAPMMLTRLPVCGPDFLEFASLLILIEAGGRTPACPPELAFRDRRFGRRDQLPQTALGHVRGVV